MRLSSFFGHFRFSIADFRDRFQVRFHRKLFMRYPSVRIRRWIRSSWFSDVETIWRHFLRIAGPVSVPFVMERILNNGNTVLKRSVTFVCVRKHATLSLGRRSCTFDSVRWESGLHSTMSHQSCKRVSVRWGPGLHSPMELSQVYIAQNRCYWEFTSFFIKRSRENITLLEVLQNLASVPVF